MPDYQTYGIEWCEEEKYPVERSVLMVSRKTKIDTARIYKCLCGALPVEKIERREEVDVHGWQKTIVLAKLSVPVADLNVSAKILVADDEEDVELKTIILKKTPTPKPVTPKPAETERCIPRLEGPRKALIEESDVPQSEKKRRIREALRSPALDVIDDLKREKPSATANDYLEALEVVFGTTLSGEELFHQFIGLDQQSGEKPSEYLSRLQTSLRQVVRKGGVKAESANQALLKQFLKGTLFDQLLLVDLHLRDQISNLPTYLTLLGKVRRWEEESSGKNKKAKAIGARNAHVAKIEAAKEEGIAERLSRLEKILLKSPMVHSYQQSAPQHQNRSTRSYFCYKCGEEGHMRRGCRNAPNPELVNQKLIAMNQQGNDRRHLRRSNQMPEDSH
ncbi:paraneoplastic antigen Ma3 homolog [Anneissia japonica]|uniref:paraneoplastic antigen Ma3 homolog n=1 Tax=Anneissia japonica TaxID=1529436 RepID=UPI00142581B8|nr:paraneoplastic antigen Ma3 homolog [Anneissia japonica]